MSSRHVLSNSIGLRRGAAAILILATAWAAGPALAGTPPQADLPMVSLQVAGRSVRAEVAATTLQQQIGLMGRKSLPADHGMVFVFAQPERVCMWMRDTLIPLSVAFIDAGGRVVNTDDMQPQTDTTHCAANDVSYALEMPARWFVDHGVKPGDRVGGLPVR